MYEWGQNGSDICVLDRAHTCHGNIRPRCSSRWYVDLVSLQYVNLKYVTHTEGTDAPHPDSLYKVGRDANGNKARVCIYTEYYRLSPRWYRKKSDMESHLRREHGIDIVLPRGMRIEEEGIPGACFNSYL